MAYNPRIIGIALITTDLARACAFYEQALGFDPVSFVRYDSAEVATLRLGEETLHLVRPDRLGGPIPSRRPQTIRGSSTSRLRYPMLLPRLSAYRACLSRLSRAVVRSCCRRAAGR